MISRSQCIFLRQYHGGDYELKQRNAEWRWQHALFYVSEGSLYLWNLTLDSGVVDTSLCSTPYTACCGGARYVDGSSASATLLGVSIKNSVAYRGGAAMAWYGKLTLIGNTFEHNTAWSGGGGSVAVGFGTLTATASNFAENSASFFGGAAFVYNYGVFTATTSTFKRNGA